MRKAAAALEELGKDREAGGAAAKVRPPRSLRVADYDSVFCRVPLRSTASEAFLNRLLAEPPSGEVGAGQSAGSREELREHLRFRETLAWGCRRAGGSCRSGKESSSYSGVCSQLVASERKEYIKVSSFLGVWETGAPPPPPPEFMLWLSGRASGWGSLLPQLAGCSAY